MTDLRYPVGKFEFTGPSTGEQRRQWIDEIAAAPAALREAARDLGEPELDTPYRPGGWTVRQVVHHVADSHLNSYVRFRLALTETVPTIKPYDEKLWAELPDARTAPVEPSLTLLESLHHRWVWLLRSCGPADFERTLNHPELGVVRLERYLALYAWHGRHHVAHITGLRARSGWN
jgi:hypothetical protein